MVDHFSGYPWVARMRSITTEGVCKILLGWFCEVGFPRELKSDGRPQFRGPFDKFCVEYNIIHETSSPYHPRSNGLSEAVVKSVKGLLRKLEGKFDSDEFRIALLAWRTNPRADGFSPAYGFFCPTVLH